MSAEPATIPSECSECAKLRAEVSELKAQVRELLDKLNRNSSNSSQPPSADPPWRRIPAKDSSGRKPGGQPGHPGAFRQRLPPGRVQQVVDYVPQTCAHCHAPLLAAVGLSDPPPSWHQVAELPVTLAVITEHRGHARTCSCCGKITQADIPEQIRAHTVGPQLAATLSYLSGRCHDSKRSVQEIAQTLFDVPLSLGTIAKLEQEMSSALQLPQAEAQAAVQAAPVKHVDETGWATGGKLCWLWLAATARVALFQVHAKRGKAGLDALLGDCVRGIVCSDRWSAYAPLRLSQRQICWAHLKRDFQKFVELGGEAARLGAAGQQAVQEIFVVWREFRAGHLSRAQLQARLQPTREGLYRAFQRERDGPHKKARRFSKQLLKIYGALWTFTVVEGVEPTNNHAERMLRPGVLWRKRSFGNHSAAGCRFAERIMSTVQTLRLQNRPVLAYLRQALTAHRAGQSTCPLVAT